MNKKVPFFSKIIFFLSAFLAVFFLVNPTLIFYQQQLGFIADGYIWRQYLSYPGGLADYLSVFLFQFTISRFWGTAMFIVLMFGIVQLLGKILNRGEDEHLMLLPILPLILLAVLIADYHYLVFLPFLMVLILLLLWILKKLVSDHKNTLINIAAIITLSVAGYYLMGGFGLFVFELSAILLVIFSNKNRKILKVSVLILIGVLLPFIAAKYIFFITINDAFWRLQPYQAEYHLKVIDYVFFSSVPFLLLANRLLPSKVAMLLNRTWLLPLQYVVLILAFILLMATKVDREVKFKLQIDQLAFNDQWEKILQKVDGVLYSDRIVAFDVNRALYHTGKMTTDLFKYNQSWGIDGLLVSKVMNDKVLLPTTELYIDFGYINEAIHWGNEAVSFRDKSPQVMEQLIKAHIIEHKYDAAQLYINIMKKMPFFRKKALYYQDMILTNFIPNELKQKRDLMPYNDFIARTFPTAGELMGLLQDRPQNKMVYEYLMSYFLLKNDVNDFVKYYSMGKRFNYGKLPRIYQEAIALYIYNQQGSGKPAPNVKLDQEVIDDFKDYLSTIKNLDGKMDIAQPVLKDKFGATYWYYVHYDSPVTKKMEITEEKN